MQTPDLLYRLMSDSEMNDWVGGGDAGVIGRTNAEILMRLAKPSDNATILDFGCGIGRTVVALLEKLPNVRIVGIDIVPEMIEFCRQYITPIYSNTEFHCTAVSHRIYDTYKKSNGPGETEDAVFERLNGTIDVILAYSVFTHLNTDKYSYYLKKLRDNLKPGGVLLLSTFLLDPVSRLRMNAGLAFRKFPKPVEATDDVYSINDTIEFFAYNITTVIKLLADAGFAVETIACGDWRGTRAALGLSYFQDFIIARPNPLLPYDFDSKRYVSLYSDLQAAQVDGTAHYLHYGFYEGRKYR
jgi:SAM-dependent methyltransferase